MTVEQFATKHRLKVKRLPQDDNAPTVQGRTGQIYEGEDDRLTVSYMPPDYHAKTWGNFRRAAVAAGMTVLQNGDSEGSLLFDPKNRIQAKLAIKVAGARPKRKISAEHLERMHAARRMV